MTIFGKILIVCNLLMTAVFVYVASVDWAKRYTWAYAVYRDELRINGLPVDKIETDPIEGVVLVDKLSENTLSQLFQPVGGNPVSTQREEVERVAKELQQAVDAQPDEKAKRALLKQVFMPLARTSGDRYAVQERYDKAPFDELYGDMQALFAEAGTGELTDEGAVPARQPLKPIVKQLLPRDKRQSIAHLLYNLKTSEEAHARLIVVIGLKAFNEEAKLQADNLEIASGTVRYAILGDRANFEVEYRKVLDDIRDIADSYGGRVFYLENQLKLKKDHTELRDSRAKNVEDAKAALKVARDKMVDNLKLQAKEEDSLFESQLILATTASDNERKEREIRGLEKVKPSK